VQFFQYYFRRKVQFFQEFLLHKVQFFQQFIAHLYQSIQVEKKIADGPKRTIGGVCETSQRKNSLIISQTRPSKAKILLLLFMKRILK